VPGCFLEHPRDGLVKAYGAVGEIARELVDLGQAIDLAQLRLEERQQNSRQRVQGLATGSQGGDLPDLIAAGAAQAAHPAGLRG
jgi:hypothetical protein